MELESRGIESPSGSRDDLLLINGKRKMSAEEFETKYDVGFDEAFLPMGELGPSPPQPEPVRKRIDYVLVYDNKQLEEVVGKKDRHRWERHQENREKFKRVMLRKGLQIQEVIYGQHVFVKIHAPFYVLCQQAENMKMQMPLKGKEVYDDGPQSFVSRLYEKYFITDDEVDFVSAPYIHDKRHLFENNQDEETFFRPALRSYLVDQILIHLDIRVNPDQVNLTQEDDDGLAKKGLPYLIMKGSYKDAFLLHDESSVDPIVDEIIKEQHKAGKMDDATVEKLKKRKYKDDPRKRLKETWTRWLKAQPMWRIRNYFGEKIAFYFAWTGLLMTSLWIPSVIGLGVFLYGLYLSFTRNTIGDTDGFVTTPDPLGQAINTANDLLESIKESFDNVVTPFFSLIICLWGTIFLETWKRKRSTLAYEWDVDGFESTEPDRPEFYGTKTKPDPVTNMDTWYYPLGRQFMKFATSCSVLILMVMIVLVSGTGVVIYRVIINVNYCRVGVLEGWQCLAASTLASSVLNAVSILILGKLYDWIAIKLTQWENHRTRSEYDNALIIKLFVFQFANSYASLFYIAFFRGNLLQISNGFFGLGPQYVDQCSGVNGNNCMSMLSFQVLVLMILKPFPKFFKDVILPWVRSLWRDGYIFSCCRRNKIRASVIAKDIHDSNDYIERERIKPRLDDFTLGEFTEKVIQYGYLMLFAVSLPLAPLIALITNLVDMRVDARRLIWVYRRPVAYMACDIGMWYSILEFVNLMGVISNALLIAFTSQFGKDYLPQMEQKLWGIIIFEHLVFGLKFIIAYIIPDVPSGVSLHMRREKYQVARIFTEDETKTDTKRRRTKVNAVIRLRKDGHRQDDKQTSGRGSKKKLDTKGLNKRGLIASSPKSLTPAVPRDPVSPETA